MLSPETHRLAARTHAVHHAYVHHSNADDAEHSDEANNGEDSDDDVEYPSVAEHDFLCCIIRGAARREARSCCSVRFRYASRESSHDFCSLTVSSRASGLSAPDCM